MQEGAKIEYVLQIQHKYQSAILLFTAASAVLKMQILWETSHRVINLTAIHDQRWYIYKVSIYTVGCDVV